MTLRALLWRLLLIKIGWARRQHRACLRRIARLELELWPVETHQEELWCRLNERIDGLSLINNAIAHLNVDDDSDAFEFEPGARWIVDDPTCVQIFRGPYGFSNRYAEHKAELTRRGLFG